MIETIKKCDRCKSKADSLINISMVNRNMVDEIEENKNKADDPWNFQTFLNKLKPPTIEFELCYGCAEILCRWSAHPENNLIVRKNQDIMPTPKSG